MTNERSYKYNFYYTKRFYSLINLCKKEDSVNKDSLDSKVRVTFRVNGLDESYNIRMNVYDKVLALLHKAYTDNVTFGFDIAIG